MNRSAAAFAGLCAGLVAVGLIKRWVSKKLKLGRVIFSHSWFSELGVMWPGQCFSLQVKKVLFEGKSKYQDIKVFDSTNHGRVLVLDNVIQLTTFDEFAYQEMMAHLPLMAHPNPRNVLIIGGGDGGVLREVCRHSCVDRAVMCELDDMVVSVSKRYLPQLASAFTDPRVELHYDDGAAFLNRSDQIGAYDVIIVDSSDPVGPAEVLFKSEFYEQLRRALKPDGIASTQGECMWIHGDTIKEVKTFSRKIFASVEYAHISIPTYPCGSICVACLSKSKRSCRTPSRELSSELAEGMRYYTEAIHTAVFAMPKFALSITANGE